MKGNFQARLCPAKAGVFSRRKTYQGKSQSPVARAETGNQPSEASRQPHLWDGGESPGRSASERTGGPESDSPGGRACNREGEGSMGRRRLADAADHSGGVGATAWGQDTLSNWRDPPRPAAKSAEAR